MDTVTIDAIDEAKKVLLSKIEYNGGGIDSLLENALLCYGSVVKSVQRGDTTLTGVGGLNNTNKSKKIEISPVNIGKSVLIATLHGNPTATASESSGNSCVVLTDETTITFTLKGGGNCGTVALSWQVIEFY